FLRKIYSQHQTLSFNSSLLIICLYYLFLPLHKSPIFNRFEYKANLGFIFLYFVLIVEEKSSINLPMRFVHSHNFKEEKIASQIHSEN
ncbi:MAG: hypothetical protein ACRDEA_12665, partial [Microcystaceae cyanobacterium]